MAFFIYFFFFSKEGFEFEEASILVLRMTSTINLVLPNVSQRVGEILPNAVFSMLEAALALSLVIVYRVGISKSSVVRKFRSGFSVGISGDSGSGKTVICQSLSNLFGPNNALVLTGDDLHKWERGDINWQKYSHLNPQGNRLFVDIDHAKTLSGKGMIQRSHYDHDTGTFSHLMKLEQRRFQIFEGSHTFYLKPMRKMIDLKIFASPADELRYYWKIRRDISERGYSKDKVVHQLEQRHGDSLQYIAPQRERSDMIVGYEPLNNTLTHTEMLHMDRVPTRLKITIGNEVNIDLLTAIINEKTKVKAAFDYLSDCDRTMIEFEGNITAGEIEDLALFLIPNVEDILENYPKWESGYRGLIQLMVLLYINSFYNFEVK